MNTTAHAQRLSEVIDLVEHAEQVRRKEDSHRLRLLASALAQVQDPAGNALSDIAARGARAGTRELAYRSLRAELATALTLSEHSVDRELTLASALTHHYPAALAAMGSGMIAKLHAQVLADEGMVIGSGDDPVIVQRRAAYEQQVLAAAEVSTPGQLRPLARRLAEVWAQTALDERHRKARCHRSVTVVDAGDGMADLLAHLPLVEAVAIKDRLTQIARAAERGEREVRSAEERAELAAECTAPHDETDSAHAHEGAVRQDDSRESLSADGEAAASQSGFGARTRDQIRADAFVEMLLEADVFSLATGSPTEAIRARIQLVAPAELVAEPDADCLVELAGHGPIDTETARGVAAHATHWENTRAHPDTGVALSVDRYRPSQQMRRLLGARDQSCRFPGCRVPVHRCDYDHTVDAAHGGPTSTGNLAALCRAHHTLKHHTGWNVEHLAGGVLNWTSPSGRHHQTRPPNVIPPRRHPLLQTLAERRESDPAHPPDSAGVVGRTQPRSRGATLPHGIGADRTVRFEATHPF